MEKEQNLKTKEKKGEKTEIIKDDDVTNKNNNETSLKEDELLPEDKIKSLEEKLARTLAEMENQRRRFEKEKDDAFEYGGFSFARESLNLIDNFDRAKQSLENDEKIKESVARSILSNKDNDSLAKLNPPNSKASCLSFSNLLL